MNDPGAMAGHSRSLVQCWFQALTYTPDIGLIGCQQTSVSWHSFSPDRPRVQSIT